MADRARGRVGQPLQLDLFGEVLGAEQARHRDALVCLRDAVPEAIEVVVDLAYGQPEPRWRWLLRPYELWPNPDRWHLAARAGPAHRRRGRAGRWPGGGVSAPSVCQRWRDRRPVWRPAGEGFRPARYSVALVDEPAARRFVERHHYSGSYPAAVLRVGLAEGTHLVGVAVFERIVGGAGSKP